MIIVRDSRLPRFDISRQKDVSMLEYVSQNPSICSTMVCNGKYCEINFKNETFINTYGWKHSAYTITEEFNDGSYMIANTLSDGCIYLNKNEKKWFDHAISLPIPKSFAQILYLGGFYVHATKDEYQFSKLLRYRHTYCDNNYFSVTILPTQDCNAQCFYCFEQEKKPIAISEEVASAIVQYLGGRLSPECTLIYTWFGGEPLLFHNIVDQIINGINAKMNKSINYTSSLITNGSLLNPSIIHKLKNLWKTTTVVLTLDGYGIEHDKRKSYKSILVPDGSAYRQALINIGDLLAAGICVICRINLDKNNIDQLPLVLSDLKLYSNNPLFSVQATTLHSPETSKYSQKRYYEEEELPAFYNDVLPCLKEFGFLVNPLKMLPHRSRGNCAACSLNAVVIGADGQLYRCYQESMVTQNSVGSVQTGIIPNETYFKWFNESLEEDKRCIDCRYFPICEGGCTFYRFSGTNSCHRAKYYYNLLLRFIHDALVLR